MLTCVYFFFSKNLKQLNYLFSSRVKKVLIVNQRFFYFFKNTDKNIFLSLEKTNNKDTSRNIFIFLQKKFYDILFF
jgi:hypothetical protein